jgi:phosphoserine phosphatase
MDGTLTKLRSSWCWLHDCFGVDNEEAYQAFVNGEIDEPEFMRRDIALWTGACPNIRIHDLVRHFQSMPLIDGIQETVACLKENGIRSVIISGGIDIAARMLKEEFGFDDFVADEICSNSDGSLTGEGKMNVDLSDKGVRVREFIDRCGTTKERTASVGNSFTDISMFRSSGLSIAFNPVDVYTEEAATHVVRSSNISDILDLILPDGDHSSS